MKKVEVEVEKRRENCAFAPLVEAGEIEDRLRYIAGVVRFESYLPAEDVRTLSGAGAPLDGRDLSRLTVKKWPSLASLKEEVGEKRRARRLYKQFLWLAGNDPTWLHTALRWLLNRIEEDEIRLAWARPWNLDSIVDEALGWLITREADSKDEVARQDVLKAIRAHRDIPRRALKRYASALAARLARSPLAKTFAPTSHGQVVISAEKIVHEMRRSTAGALRLIKGGKLPVARLAGEVVSTADLLRPHRRYGESAIAA